MKLGDLFKKLSYAELSNLTLGGEGSGTVDPARHGKLIQATNDALKEIFTRFVVLERQCIVKTLDWKNLYYLRKQYAMMDSTPGLKYIIDTPSNLFTDDIVKVLIVTNEIGEELPINDAEQWASVFTPQYDCIQFNHPGYSQIFNVGYQALHPELVESGTDPLQQEVRIPPTLEELLRTRIAYCVFAAMSGQDYSLKAQALLELFEGKVALIEAQNLFNGTRVSTNTKLERRGFV